MINKQTGRMILHNNRSRLADLVRPARRLARSVAADSISVDQLRSYVSDVDGSIWEFSENETQAPRDPTWSDHLDPLQHHSTTYVAEVPGDALVFQNRHSVDSNRRVVYETAIPFNSLGIAFERLEEPALVPGSVAYLSNSWSDNYSHFLTLTVPFLRMYREAGLKPDFYYVGHPIKEWQLELLEFFGIRRQQVVGYAVKGDTAIATLVDAKTALPSPSGLQFVQGHLPTRFDSAPGRRLFVGRGPMTTTRRMIDEAELAGLLVEEFGFEYIESTASMSTLERAEVFGQAKVVVMPHGAAHTNLFFCQPGTQVLDLQSGASGVPPLATTQSLCWSLGQTLGLLVGEPITDPTRTGLAQDIYLKPHVLVDRVSKMLDSASG